MTVHDQDMSVSEHRRATSIFARHAAATWNRLAQRVRFLYDTRLRWFVGERFLVLAHRDGRRGRWAERVVRVLYHDERSDAYVVVLGRGARPRWLRDVNRSCDVVITVGARRVRARVAMLNAPVAALVLRRYASLHPLGFAVLTAAVPGPPRRGTAAYCERLVATMTLVALFCKDTDRHAAGPDAAAPRDTDALTLLGPRCPAVNSETDSVARRSASMDVFVDEAT
jgi:hypothetical protein